MKILKKITVENLYNILGFILGNKLVAFNIRNYITVLVRNFL